jgi:hypothetical protein
MNTNGYRLKITLILRKSIFRKERYSTPLGLGICLVLHFPTGCTGGYANISLLGYLQNFRKPWNNPEMVKCK